MNTTYPLQPLRVRGRAESFTAEATGAGAEADANACARAHVKASYGWKAGTETSLSRECELPDLEEDPCPRYRIRTSAPPRGLTASAA
jgi:hypothetical protein